MTAAAVEQAKPDGHRAATVALLLATWMQAATTSLPNATLLHLQGTLSMSDDEVGWVFSVYIAASAVTMPLTRWFAGRYGRKLVYQCSIAVFALGLVLATRAETPMEFVAARIVQGAASGPLGPLSLAILLDLAAAGPARPLQLHLGLRHDLGHPQRPEHRRLARRVSWLALDLLSEPADLRVHLPRDRASRFPRRRPNRTRPSTSSGSRRSRSA